MADGVEQEWEGRRGGERGEEDVTHLQDLSVQQ